MINTRYIIRVVLSSKCSLFHNFVFFSSNDTNICHKLRVKGLDTSVGIAISYETDGMGIEIADPCSRGL
jgi:hypothetical protein